MPLSSGKEGKEGSLLQAAGGEVKALAEGRRDRPGSEDLRSKHRSNVLRFSLRYVTPFLAGTVSSSVECKVPSSY